IEALGQIGEHALVGDLDQVAADEARRDAPPPQQRDEQHRRVPAAPAALGEGLLGGPDPGLLADDIIDPVLGPAVDLDERVDGAALARELGEERLEARPGRERGIIEGEERPELAAILARVAKPELLDPMIDEEVEGVDRTNLDGHLDEDVEAGD